jgi:hypothetical protein
LSVKGAIFDENSEEIRLWKDRYSSESLRYQYLKHLKEYCLFHKKSPRELLDIKRTQGADSTAEKMLDVFVLGWTRQLAQRRTSEGGKVPDSVRAMAVRAVRSFYAAHYLDLAKRAGSGAKFAKSKPYRIPTQEDLRAMCVGLNIRDIAIINVLSSGGFREETLSKLTWGHILPELEKWDKVSPVHIGVMGRDLKGGGVWKYHELEQRAFLTPYAVEVLLQYKAFREKRGETITPKSPLIAKVADRGRRREDRRSDGSISLREIRAIFERASEDKPFKFSPHDLRRFTQTQLETARVQPNLIRKMLGKTVRGEEAPYSRPKIEALRDAFRSALPYLSLAPSTDKSSDEKIAGMLIAMAKSQNVSEDKIKAIERAFSLGTLTLDAFQEKMFKEISEAQRSKGEGEIDVVDEDKLKNHLNHDGYSWGSPRAGAV